MKVLIPRRRALLGASAALITSRGDAATIVTRGAASAQSFGFGAKLGSKVYAAWSATDHSSNLSVGTTNFTHDTLTSTGGGTFGRSSISNSAGKWYFELQETGSLAVATGGGVALATASFSSNLGADAAGWCIQQDDGGGTAGAIFNNSVLVNSVGRNLTSGGRWTIAFDISGGKLWIGTNGTYNGNPSAGTGADVTGIAAGSWFIAGQPNQTGNTCVLYAGATALLFTVPTGFNAGFYN